MANAKPNSIDWNYLEAISKDPVEFQEIKRMSLAHLDYRRHNAR
ncbi:MAG: hypothetical protein ABSF63_06130 [Candidatus Bathyarchaeia archaeon]